MVRHNIQKLIRTLQPQNDHQRVLDIRMLSRCAIMRRLVQIHMQREQRRQHIVLKLLNPLLPCLGQHLAVHQIEKRLMRIQARNDKGCFDELAPCGLHAQHALAIYHNAPRLGLQPNLAVHIPHGSDQCPRQIPGPALAHLRLALARQQRGNVMPKLRRPQIDLAQPIEKQQPGLNNRMLKLPLHELEGRQRTDIEQQPALSGLRQNFSPQPGRHRRCLRLGGQDIFYNGHKRIAPSPQGARIPVAESGKTLRRAIKIRPPFQHIAIFEHQGHIQFGFDILRAIPLEIQIIKPRHVRHPSVKKGMRIVQKTRIAGVFNRSQPASGCV